MWEQVAVLCPNNGSSAGPLLCPSVKLGRSQTALLNRLEAPGRSMLASDSSRRWGGGSQEGHCMQVSHLLSSHLLLAVTHWMDSGVASFSRVCTQGVQSSSAEAQKSSWV